MQVSGNRVEVSGAVTLDTAKATLVAGLSALATDCAASSDVVFDLSKAGPLDSSALAVVFAWVRDAQAANKRIVLSNPPQELLSLAAVYGVSDMLPLA
jgi:phospholipid transport system transporter-binding protein